MAEKLTFSVTNIELLEESNDSQFATLKIDAFASGDNAHSLYVGEQALRNAAKTILEKPIVWKYSPTFNDAMSHEKDEYAVGFIPKDTSIDFKTLEDGRIMMSIVGKLWTRYSGKLMEIFQRDKSKSVSVEIEVLEQENESKFGMPEILSFCYRCITVLGQMVKPAIKNAKADLVAFAIQEESEYQEAYLKEFSNKYADIDFTIPKKIKNNARKSLDTYREKGISTNSVHLAMARFLVNNEVATPEKIKSMAQFFNRKVQYDDITLGFYGHSEGAKWSKELVSKLEEIDSKHLSYFSRQEETEKKEESFVEENTELEKNVEQMAEEKLPESETKPEELEMAEKKEEEKEESPKEEEKETPAEEKKEEEKEEKQEAKMSLDENLDMAAYLGFLENTTEVSEEMAAKYKGTDGTLNHEAIHKMAYDKMCKMAEDLKKAQEDKDVYMSELDNLKKFKKDTEDKQFACELESTFAEVADVLPKEEVTKFREESVNYSIETLAELQNKIKAVAFSYTGKSKKAEDGITRFATSWVNQKSEKDYSHGWVGKAE